MTKYVRNFALLMTIAMVVSLPAVAQQAALTGTVSDPTGAVIPGAEVTLTHKGTGATRTTTSGANGGYLFNQLEPGRYRLEISTQGFKTGVRDPVTLPVGITSTLNVALEIGAVTEQVVVEEGVAGINTVDASMGTPISGTEILNLPSADLDPAGLLSLQAGVTYVPGGVDNPGGYSGIMNFDGRGGSVNGARSDQTNITLDGVDVNDAENGFAFTSAIRATQASLQEFRVTTTNYNADQGRSSAAQVQLVTKSGTNTPHGMVYWTHRNEAFGATDFFNNRDGVDKGKLRRHVYGVALGGPIKKDRLFLFGNFEKMEHAEGSSSLRNIPTDSFRDGVIIYECDDPALCPGGTVNGLTGSHTVPAGFYGLTPLEFAAIDPLGIGPNPAVIAYLTQFPSVNSTGSRDNINIGGFRFNSPVQNEFKTYIARADYNIDAAGNHTFYARGTLQDDAVISAGPFFPGNSPNQLLLGNSRGLAFGYKAVLSPTVINTLRYGYTRIGEEFSGVRNSEYVGLRFISELNGFDGTASTRTRFLDTQHFRNDMSITRGSHTMSFGADFRFTRNNRSTNANSFHGFVVNPSWLPNVGRQTQPGEFDCFQQAANAPFNTSTGCTDVPAVAGGFTSSWNDTAPNLLGIISQVNGRFNLAADGGILASGEAVRRRFAVDEYEIYIQDQWRMTPTLTLTYGTRFFVTSPPWETNGLQVTPTPNLGDWFAARRTLMLNGLPTNNAPDIGFDLGGPANNGKDYYAWDWNNWSPRVALAWAPRMNNWFSGNGKLVIRGGYSLVYDRVGNGLVSSFDRGGSFGMATDIASTFGGCDEGLTGPLAAVNGSCPRYTGILDTAAAKAASLPAAPAGGFPAVPPPVRDISTALDSSIVTPYAHVMNVSIARDLPGNFTVEVAYVGRRARKLLIARDLAMQADLVDQASGMSWFEANVQLIGMAEQGQDIVTMGTIPFWENLFPGWGPTGANSGELACDIFGVGGAGGFSATQVAYDFINCLHPDTTFAAWVIDGFTPGGFNPGHLNCAGGTDIDGDAFLDCPFAFFDDQFATLNAWSSIARSEYHAFQLTVRRRLSRGIGFTFNYSLSHSLDHSSTPERQDLFGFFNGGGSGTTLNSWQLENEYASSDFDMRHQINSNWYVEIPFGHGKALGGGMPGWANQIIGGWQVSGIFRSNSGLPASVANGRVWPTNWNLSGRATCSGQGADNFGVQYGACPTTQNVKNAAGDRGPNLFADPDLALEFVRQTLPGDSGNRNAIRADNYINLDLAIAKAFPMPWEGHSFKFRWEMFNLTNSVYFDAVSLNLSQRATASFGNYTAVMGAPRRMQVSLRYEF